MFRSYKARGIIYLTPHTPKCSSRPADGSDLPEAGAPVLDLEYAAALAASAAAEADPELAVGCYPRAHPVEVFAREGGLDIAFIFDRKWRRLPEGAFEHAAIEVGRHCDKEITAEDYAAGAAFFLTALRRAGWTVLPPTAPDPMLYTLHPNA
jgi:hypothetical protein